MERSSYAVRLESIGQCLRAKVTNVIAAQTERNESLRTKNSNLQGDELRATTGLFRKESARAQAPKSPIFTSTSEVFTIVYGSRNGLLKVDGARTVVTLLFFKTLAISWAHLSPTIVLERHSSVRV